MVLKINDKEYKVKFGYNSFCDTDLMERTSDLIKLFSDNKTASDSDVKEMGKLKELFVCVRELLFVGFKKYNPVESLQAVGDLLDDYHDEKVEGEERSLFHLFASLSEELMDEGFFGDLVSAMTEATPKKKK